MSDALRVLSAPDYFVRGIYDTNRPPELAFRFIWDTGASFSISHVRSDFPEGVRPSSTTVLKGLATGLKVEGEGEVNWTVMDNDGKPFEWKHTAYYVPTAGTRLLSCQSFTEFTYRTLGHAYEYVLCSAIKPGYFRLQPDQEVCTPDTFRKIPCPLDERTNLPISTG
jgi:hypothetical protein